MRSIQQHASRRDLGQIDAGQYCRRQEQREESVPCSPHTHDFEIPIETALTGFDPYGRRNHVTDGV